MKVLFVCSETNGKIAPFIEEQASDLIKLGLFVDIYKIKGKGVIGYLSAYGSLLKVIRINKPDIVHAHYGLSGLLANLQRKVPVVTTFHGSDINVKKPLKYSRLACWLSSYSIFVSADLKQKLSAKKRAIVIPCGVDIDVFNNPERVNNSKQENSYNILFSSSFTNPVKNYPLAQKSCLMAEKQLNKKINLIALNGYSRKEVASVMSQADCLLVTSFSEGSPQFIKEGMACNRPIIATNVGDVEWLFGDESGHFLTNFDPEDVAHKITLALQFTETNKQTSGRKRLKALNLESKAVAGKIIEVYQKVMKNK